MLCKNCGNDVDEGVQVCAICGTVVSEDETQTEVPQEQPVEEQIVPPKKKKGKGVLLAVIAVVLVAALGIGGWFGFTAWQNAQDYDRAVSLLTERKYEEALSAFKNLEDYKDSARQVEKLTKLQKDYDAAVSLLAERKYDEALSEFKSLESYKDSAEQTEKLSKLQKDYDGARKLLNEEQLSEAQAAFAALGDYRDCAQFTKYAEAKAAFADAENAEEYAAAAELFAALETFEDSEAMTSKCYLEAAFAAVEAEDDAQSYVDRLNEEDRNTFDGSFHDAEILADWEEALQERFDMEEQSDEDGYDYAGEIEILEDCLELACIDHDLKKLLKNYVGLVEDQQDNLDEYDYIYSMLEHYELELERSIILDELNEKYGFLEENEELHEAYIGREEYFESCVAIEESLMEWFEYGSDIQQRNGQHYVDYINNTEYAFTLYAVFFYFDEQGELLKEQEFKAALIPGRVVRFILDAPYNTRTWDVAVKFDEYEELDMETTTR